MTPEQTRIARKFFQYEIYKREGTAFESLFTRIMDLAFPGFVQVKPQGTYGDRKNDGYIKAEGVYYQVYAPENIVDNVATAAEKAKNDFAGLVEFWQGISPIRKYHFCYNDKYKGTFPSIEQALAEIAKEHGITANTFLAKHLETILFACGDDIILDIVGGVPDPAAVDVLDFSILHEVVEHILNLSLNPMSEPVLDVPDFLHKIKFNNLGPDAADLLEKGSYHIGALDEYFDKHSELQRSDVRNHLSALYDKSKQEISADTSGAQEARFFFILEEASPGTKTWKYKTAVLIVMSYFFEACDIFEPPQTNVTA